MAERKKSKQTKGIKPASAMREIRAGADGKARVSRKGTELAIAHVESAIKQLAHTCSELLEISKRKKVTKQFLLAAVKHNKTFYCQRRVVAAVEGAHVAQAKQDRQSISVESGVRLLRKGLKKDQIISADAKVAIAQIIKVMLRNIGHDAFVFSENAKRQTIASRDVKAVLEIRVD
jgi:histone H3/H4